MRKILILVIVIIPVIYSCNTSEKEEVVIPSAAQPEVAIIKINTENNTKINSKINYINADFSLNSEKVTQKIQIRGRGNSTWGFPKKPYKIKFETKTSILGLKPARDWVLLANYLDGSLMLNASAMKIGELLQIPYVNHIKPVDLWINNEYTGSYVLTEQVEAQANRVALGPDDFLFCMDKVIESDEQYFTSAGYKLPIMIKHPENLSSTQIEAVKSEFKNLETLMQASNYPSAQFYELFDIDAMANYFLVQLLTGNQELNHPKSTFFYKTKKGKYNMGPIWDFDWAYGFEQSGQYYLNPGSGIFWGSQSVGNLFFKRLYDDPKTKDLLSQKWKSFKNLSFAELKKFVDNYAKTIEQSRTEDHKLWKRGNPSIDIEKENLKKWFDNRALYLDKVLGG